MNLFMPKRDGLMAILLMGIALGAALMYYFWGTWQQTRATATGPMPSLPDIQVPDEAVLKEMAVLRKHLNRLAYPRAAGSQVARLSLFGYTPAATGMRLNKRAAKGMTPPPVQFDYTLSFALAAGNRKLCLLDGQLFTQGAVLADGGRILTIEPERVLIEKTPLQRWIYLQEPQLGREAPTEARGPMPSTDEEL